jgi:hypothetical protein
VFFCLSVPLVKNNANRTDRIFRIKPSTFQPSKFQ